MYISREEMEENDIDESLIDELLGFDFIEPDNINVVMFYTGDMISST